METLDLEELKRLYEADEEITQIEYNLKLDELKIPDNVTDLKIIRAMQSVNKEKTKELKGEFETKKIEGIKQGEALKYMRARVFAIQDGYYVYMANDETIVATKPEFKNALGDRIKFISKVLYESITDDNRLTYRMAFYKEHFYIDHATRRINLMKQMKYNYIENAVFNDETLAKAQLFFDYVLQILSNSEQNIYEYMLKMFSMYFKQEQTKTILYLQTSLEGSGKSTLLNFLKLFMGEAYTGASINLFTGQDMFTASLVGRTIVTLEETACKSEAGFKEMERMIKDLSTNNLFSYRGMQKVGKDQVNITNLIICSNYMNVECGRRGFIPQINCSKVGDREYFGKLNAIMNDNDVMQCIFNKIYSLDTSSFESIDIPKSVKHQDIIIEQRRPHDKFFIHHFLLEKNSHKVKRTELYEAFVSYCKNNNIKAICNSNTIYGSIREFQGERPEPTDYKVNGYDYFNVNVPNMEKIYKKKSYYSDSDLEQYNLEKLNSEIEFVNPLDVNTINQDNLKLIKNLQSKNLELEKTIEELKKQLAESQKVKEVINEVKQEIKQEIRDPVNHIYKKVLFTKKNETEIVNELFQYFDSIDKNNFTICN